MLTKIYSAGWLAALAALVLGCTQAEESATVTSAEPASIDGSVYLLDAEPEDAKTIIETREAAKDGDEVVVLGRIGGSREPWVDGRAAFSIVDPSLEACSDIPGDQCPTPWDYCCEVPALPNATALIKVVDADGSVVPADARELLNVKELDTVVARGTAQRDDEGNLTVLASGVYVKDSK